VAVRRSVSGSVTFGLTEWHC